MNTLQSNHTCAKNYPPLNFHQKGNEYIELVKHKVAILKDQELIDGIESHITSESPHCNQVVSIGDTDNAQQIILFTHDRHGVELTSELGLSLIESGVFASGTIKNLIDEGKVALVFLFCSNPNGIINQIRNLGDGTGADIMRSSKIIPHLGIKDKIIASKLFSGDSTSHNHLPEDEFPLPEQAKFQQDHIESYLTGGQNIIHIDIHTDPTEYAHRVLFSPAHIKSYTKLLDANELNSNNRRGAQFMRISDFYESVRRIIAHQKLPLKRSYQQYRSIGDPVDYHTAKSVRDKSYQGVYKSLTYEIPTSRYAITGLIDGSSYMPHIMDNILHYPIQSSKMILNPSQLYNIPESQMPYVVQKYNHNISTLLTELLT